MPEAIVAAIAAPEEENDGTLDFPRKRMDKVSAGVSKAVECVQSLDELRGEGWCVYPRSTSHFGDELRMHVRVRCPAGIRSDEPSDADSAGIMIFRPHICHRAVYQIS